MVDTNLQQLALLHSYDQSHEEAVTPVHVVHQHLAQRVSVRLPSQRRGKRVRDVTARDTVEAGLLFRTATYQKQRSPYQHAVPNY